MGLAKVRLLTKTLKLQEAKQLSCLALKRKDMAAAVEVRMEHTRRLLELAREEALDRE